MPTQAQIDAAIAEIDTQEVKNIAAVADKHNIVRSTLNRHYNGVTKATKASTDSSLKYFTNAQEQVLIEEINRLATYGLHITLRILHNIAEELLQHAIGKNWVYRFLERHTKVIISVYLKGFDRQRIIADNPTLLAHFYSNVSVLY